MTLDDLIKKHFLRRRHILKKLVPETCMCVGQSGTKFFLVQDSCMKWNTALFHHRNCPARDTNRATWLDGELFWCKKLW